MKNKIIVTVTCLLLMGSIMLSAESPGASRDISEAIRLTDFGVEAAKKGLWEEALDRWQQALEADPLFPAAHNNLAVVYENMGEYERAREHYIKALTVSDQNRYISSNNRMFMQFYYKYIKSEYVDSEEKSLRQRLASARGEEEIRQEATANQRLESFRQMVESEKDRTKQMIKQVNDQISDSTYRKVGSTEQVFIKHPKRTTPFSGLYKRVYIAGFAPVLNNQINLNFETTEYLRSELRKSALYELIPLEELKLPADMDKFDTLIDDYEFWSRLGNKVGADLIIYGLVNFYDEPSDGIYPYEYYDRRTGEYRTVQRYIQRTAFVIELDLFFHEASTGELVHQESLGQTIVYRGRLDPSLQAFYDVMNRVLPRFMDLMVPREHEAIRFLIFG